MNFTPEEVFSMWRCCMSRGFIKFCSTVVVTLLSSTLLYNNLKIKIYKTIVESRRLRWAGHVARMEEGRSAYKILTGIPTGKIPLGRPRRNVRTILAWTLKR